VRVEDLLARSAQRLPDKVALVAGDRRLTYAQVAAAAAAVTATLQARGVVPGDRVALCMDDPVETIAGIFGVLAAGGVFVSINAAVKPQKLALLLDDTRAAAILCRPARAAELAARPHLRAILTPADLAAGDVAPASGDGLAGILYTSGSDGAPKGVMLSHGNVLAAIDAIVGYLGIVEDDVIFNVLPLSFGYGLTQLFSAFSAGARLVVEKGMVFPDATLAKLAAERATGFAVVPTIAAVLLGRDLASFDLSSLRYLTNAGAGLPVAHLAKLRAALPHVGLVCMYGQTECLRISYLDPADVDARPGSVGKGMPGQEHRIVDEHGAPVPPGVVGELLVRGPHVMQGYWGLPEESAAKLAPVAGFGDGPVLHCGDLFRADADGFLYFVARKDDIIKARGEKVSPREVEDALHRLDGVAEAAVIGVPDPILGEAVKAVIVLAPGARLEARQVQLHCARNLDDHMVPSVVEFRAEMPRNVNGKIDRQALRAVRNEP
jgi:amino acid adenylation domain-containing protein